MLRPPASGAGGEAIMARLGLRFGFHGPALLVAAALALSPPAAADPVSEPGADPAAPDPRAIGTLIPATDADLAEAGRAAALLARANSACAEAHQRAACVLTPCAARADAARRLAETLSLLRGMEPWLVKARKAALAHYTALMQATIASGERQAYLERWYANAKFLQDLGKLTLAVADLANFAKSFRADGANLKALLADPSTSDFARTLARADHIDQMMGAFQNAADVANTLIGSYRERGEPIPEWLANLSTLKQAASDVKNGARGFLEATSLLREAEMLRRHATTVADAAEKARLVKEAADKAALARTQWSDMRQAVMQLIGKALVAWSESQLADMQDEIGELQRNIEAEALPIHEAWLDWQRLSMRTDALVEAIAALEGAETGMGACMSGCAAPADAPPPPPAPPSFVDPDGKERWGDALRWYQQQLALATAALSQGVWAGEPGISPSYPPVVGPIPPPGGAGSEIAVEADVDRCTAADGDMMVGDAERPLNGETHPVLTFPAPAGPGPVRVVIRRPGRPDWSGEADYVSTGGGTPADEDPCGAIDCDCDNIEAGILTGPYVDECKASEAALKERCAAQGHIEGVCHETAQGPNAYPR